MDWINEKVEQFRKWVRNLSVKKAMIVYIVILCVVVFTVSSITITVSMRWEELILERHPSDSWKKYNDDFWSRIFNLTSYPMIGGADERILKILNIVRIWCPFVYAFLGIFIMSSLFYKRRLMEPFRILKKGTGEIRKNNLDFEMHYDSRDEMGQLCDSFEEMRKELVNSKEQMWELIEKQKELNAAFAHDLRTPLTVLKGYSDFLARYIPEGKVPREKLTDTLHLMSAHIERLEAYSRTMKGIQSIEEMPVARKWTDALMVQKKVKEVVHALNQVGGVSIQCNEEIEKPAEVFIDDNIVMEVLENLLSNAIRYAKERIDVSTAIKKGEQLFFITVKDDGPGFSHDDLQNAIQPYYGESAEQEHFGIGLHICTLLCRKHGGNLSLANSIRGGAVVTASFSLKEE